MTLSIIPFDYSLLLSPASPGSASSPSISSDSAAVVKARAAFTTPQVDAPWAVQQSSIASNLLSALAQARTTTNFVSLVANVGGKAVNDPDLQTSFTVFTALDKLNTIAKAAAQSGVSDSDRQSLNKIFQTGLRQVQDFLATANGDKLRFAFTTPTSNASTTTLPSTAQNISGTGIVANRTDAIPGIAGNEVLTVKLDKGGGSDSVNVNLSTISGPITLDAVANAVNTAIAAVPLTQNGSVVTDPTTGAPVSKYLTRMTVQKDGDKWGFSWTTPETETVSLQQANASDALVVSAAQNLIDGPIASRVLKMTDVTGTLAYQNMATISAVDANATALAALQPPPTTTSSTASTTAPKPDTTVYAKTSAAATATTADGYSYVVGTTQGGLGGNVETGQNDLFLTKLDSNGKIVWQRQLGANGDTQGLAVTVDARGNAIVAGSTTAHLSATDAFDGQDAFVAKYDSSGNQTFATQIDGMSASKGAAVTVDSSDNIYLGGTVSGHLSGQTANGGDDAMVVKLSTTGQVLAKTQFGTAGTDGVTALAVHPDGSLIVATNESGQGTIHQLDTTSLTDSAPSVALGTGQVSSIAIDATTGDIAVGGTTVGGLTTGTAVNSVSGYNDGFVARLGSNLSVNTVTYLGTSGTDSVDSLTYMNGALYAGGRTNGVLGATRSGNVDGFVARLDATSGAIQNVRQFGGLTNTVDQISISAAVGGDNVLGKLGLQQGQIAQASSDQLTSETDLRAGDSFSIQVGTMAAAKIVIQNGDTIDSLASRINLATGYRIGLSVNKLSTGTTLKFTAKTNLPIELIAGPQGTDALSKLGLRPQRLSLPQANTSGSIITPGGSYALELNDAFSLDSAKDATFVSTRLDQAIATVQSAYRSLYWDDTKAMLVNGSSSGSLPPNAYMSGQIAMYQDALARISSVASSWDPSATTTDALGNPVATTDSTAALLGAAYGTNFGG